MTTAVAALLAPVRSIAVWPGIDHDLSLAEALLVETAGFARLKGLRQMGLAFHAFPNAENSRASHSLGVAAWASRWLAALRDGDDETRRLLAELDATGLSAELVVRLFALLHDIDLLPLGHTLRYQCGLLAEADGHPRRAALLGAMAGEVEHRLPTPALRATFRLHLAEAERAFEGLDGLAGLARELVNSGIGADLVDFALRDSAAIGRPQVLATGFAEALRLRMTDRLRLATDADGAGIADDLYRARFEIFAQSIANPRKLAADAMLDGAVRRVLRRAPIDDAGIAMMTDEGFLEWLETVEQSTLDGDAVTLVPALRDGRLHGEAWRTADLRGFARLADAQVALALTPAWRTAAEAALRSSLPWAANGDVLVGVFAPTMQAKPADALVSQGDTMFGLGEARSHGLHVAAPDICAAYAGLWSLRVYLAPRWAGREPEVAAAATRLWPL